ncbi:MAG: AAA family ATPase [Bacteroidales bacterium]|nr:AAA family ATPase [Bacteroidales bacterium]
MGQTIVGRKKELSLINQYFNSGKAEFIAVYGRRRVGKTFLIRQHFRNQFAFDMTGIMEGTKSEQMTAFHTALKTYGYTGKKNTNWIDAFFALRQVLESRIEEGKRCVIFIDELPCLDTPKAGFVNALGHFWNNWANWQSEIMLIVCGSATSWMVRNVIDNHGGLHDRITHEIHLHPFTLTETEEFFKLNGFSWNRLSIMQTYMAIGGIPYYMSLFERTDSPATGLDRLFFSGNAELKKEYRRLFSSLFKNPHPYLEIITLLSKHPKGMTREEISTELKTSNNGKLGEMLTDLIYCDFLQKNNVREKRIKSNSAIYQLIDFYTIFYNTFANKNIMEEHFWTRNINTPEINIWYGLAFERVCKAHIEKIKTALGIASVSTEYYSWRSNLIEKGAQIDIIIDRADNTINLCEVKYSENLYSLDKEEYMKIQNRISVFKEATNTRSNIIPTMITTFGMKEGTYSDQIIAKINMEDLF